MEPVTTSVVAALIAGAVAASKDVATAAIKDAYDGLKHLIIEKCAPAKPAVDSIDAKPSDEAGPNALGKQLQDAGVGADKDLEALAKKLIDAVAELEKDPKAKALFDFKKLKVARDMKLTNISSIRQVLVADDADIGGDFIVDNINDGGTKNPKA